MQPSASRICEQEIPAIAEMRRLEDEIPEDIEIQSPTIEERDDINADIKRLEDEISGVVDMYGKKTTVNYILLTTCAAVDGSVLAGVWSSQQMKNFMGCGSAWGTFILSGLLSTSIISAFVYVFFVQFRLLKRAKQLQQHRDSIIDRSLPNATWAAKRRFCSTYSRKVFASTSATWWLPRAVFLTVLIAISACLLLSVARLLC